jgi:hypothetical protein
VTEISRLTHELENTREQKDQLTSENKKLEVNSYFPSFTFYFLTKFPLLDKIAELKSQYSTADSMS